MEKRIQGDEKIKKERYCAIIIFLIMLVPVCVFAGTTGTVRLNIVRDDINDTIIKQEQIVQQNATPEFNIEIVPMIVTEYANGTVVYEETNCIIENGTKKCVIPTEDLTITSATALCEGTFFVSGDPCFGLGWFKKPICRIKEWVLHPKRWYIK